MPKLTASLEMKKVALEDEPEKVRTYSGYTRIRRKYKCYMNCMVQNGILKAALYLPDHLRLDGDNPAYEVFLDKKKRQFLTYDYLDKKWRDAKLDRLEWPGQDYDAVCWVGTEDSDMVLLDESQHTAEFDVTAAHASPASHHGSSQRNTESKQSAY